MSRTRLLTTTALLTLGLGAIAACGQGEAGPALAGGTSAVVAAASTTDSVVPAETFDPVHLRAGAGKKRFTALGTRTPQVSAVASSAARELGMRFTVSQASEVVALRFYKGTGNTGPRRATLWKGRGVKLASAKVTESARGWQSVQLAKPIAVAPGTTYTVSYTAPRGHWSLTKGGFSAPRSSGPIRVPAEAARYGSPHSQPLTRAGNRNFFVDVAVRRAAADPGGTLDLPRIAWEGGPSYWSQFPRANAAGWDEDTFFPIVVWFNGISSNQEVAYDKAVGINSYIGMYEGTDFKLFEDNNVFWIGDALNNTFKQNSKNWVGDFLDDEVDGRYPPDEGLAHLQQLLDERRGDGRFKYANFTQMIMSSDLDPSIANAYTNRFTDAVSMDMYWYTIPYCDWRPYRDPYITPVEQNFCRTSSSYGKTMESLRRRDSADGELQARWQFIEALNGGPGEGPFVRNIAPGELQGAVMSSVINEARGLVYFNQSLSGPCQTGTVVRQAQVNQTFCGRAQVAAARSVNNLIHDLAPVINTQSYDYRFGPRLDTMLKTYHGNAYVFAMVDGSAAPGSRTFTLPAGVKGRRVSVVGENRSLTATADGTFTDSFAAEYSFHVYRIPLT